jgi:hypothetical protein
MTVARPAPGRYPRILMPESTPRAPTRSSPDQVDTPLLEGRRQRAVIPSARRGSTLEIPAHVGYALTNEGRESSIVGSAPIRSHGGGAAPSAPTCLLTPVRVGPSPTTGWLAGEVRLSRYRGRRRGRRRWLAVAPVELGPHVAARAQQDRAPIPACLRRQTRGGDYMAQRRRALGEVARRVGHSVETS